jgi:hypothetical protein
VKLPLLSNVGWRTRVVWLRLLLLLMTCDWDAQGEVNAGASSRQWGRLLACIFVTPWLCKKFLLLMSSSSIHGCAAQWCNAACLLGLQLQSMKCKCSKTPRYAWSLLLLSLTRYVLCCSFAATGGACRLRSFVTFSAAGSSLLWLAMLVVLLLFALCMSWFLVAWGADALLGSVSQ